MNLEHAASGGDVRLRGVAALHLSERTVVALLLAFATVLRFAEIGEASYWRDEVFSVDIVRLPFVRMLHEVARTEGTPPVYYAAGWTWSRIFGTHEAALRSLSAVAGVLAVGAVYLATLWLFGRPPAILAGLFAATSPLLVWYGQEARAYELGILAVSVSFAALARVRHTGPSARAAAVWAGASCVALATHYFAVFVVLPEAVWLLRLSSGRARRSAAVAIAAVGATGVALVPLVLAQRGNPGWIAGRPLLRRVLEVPSEFLAGPQPSVVAVAVPTVVVWAYGAWMISRRDRTRAVFVLSVGACGIGLPIVLSLVGVDFFLARNVVFAWPFLAVAVAAGLASTRVGRVAAAAVIVLNVAVVAATAGQPKYGSEDWRAAATAVGTPSEPRAYVVSPLAGEKAFRYYRPAAAQTLAAALRVREVDVVALPPEQHPIGRDALPPRPDQPRQLRGFRLASSVHADTFTLLRYVASGPRFRSLASLRQLALEPTSEVLIEPPPG